MSGHFQNASRIVRSGSPTALEVYNHRVPENFLKITIPDNKNKKLFIQRWDGEYLRVT
jgi:hypothetical protein